MKVRNNKKQHKKQHKKKNENGKTKTPNHKKFTEHKTQN